MDITKVISISGFPGLYKVVAQASNGLIVESLVDKKRMPAYSSYKISGMEDISMFTTGDDKPLKEVFKAIFEKEQGGPALDHKSTDEEIRQYFAVIVPEYDKERVRISDMKKAIQWYNILQKTELLTAEEPKEDEKLSLDKDKGAASHKGSLKDAGSKTVKTNAPHVKTQGVRKIGGGS
ncbi:MAG: DUF5606 domain-containing protein [Bacteroidia bacterium]|nr:DUF5606 domain-containing protein [Bacteroidia bacterium]